MCLCSIDFNYVLQYQITVKYGRRIKIHSYLKSDKIAVFQFEARGLNARKLLT